MRLWVYVFVFVYVGGGIGVSGGWMDGWVLRHVRETHPSVVRMVLTSAMMDWTSKDWPTSLAKAVICGESTCAREGGRKEGMERNRWVALCIDVCAISIEEIRMEEQ